MTIQNKRPIDIVARAARRREGRTGADGTWRRETFCLPRLQAREKAREWFERFPKAAYMTQIESWRELAGDKIEFVIRRLPTAD